MHSFFMKIQDWISRSGRYWKKRLSIRPIHAATELKSSKTLHEVDATFNLCTEEIWRSSNGTNSHSRDTYAFQVAYIDTGAQKSVIGKWQVLCYCNQHNIWYALKPLLTKFEFGDGVFSLLDIMQIRILTPN